MPLFVSASAIDRCDYHLFISRPFFLSQFYLCLLIPSIFQVLRSMILFIKNGVAASKEEEMEVVLGRMVGCGLELV